MSQPIHTSASFPDGNGTERSGAPPIPGGRNLPSTAPPAPEGRNSADGSSWPASGAAGRGATRRGNRGRTAGSPLSAEGGSRPPVPPPLRSKESSAAGGRRTNRGHRALTEKGAVSGTAPAVAPSPALRSAGCIRPGIEG